MDSSSQPQTLRDAGNFTEKKRVYRKPGVQVYGTLSQLTGTRTGGGRRSDSGGGNPGNRRT